jgi:hypothetical protein
MNNFDNSIWKEKGATLSDKSVRKIYKLTQDEILEGINNGKLQYKVNYIYGNPWFRLLKIEVERFIEEKYGKTHLQLLKLKIELKEIETELKTINKRAKELENRRKEVKEKIITLNS